MKIPSKAANPDSFAAEHIAKFGIDSYKKEYNAGYATAGRTSDSAKYNSGVYTWAWEDGYLDRAAGRPKWHMLTCPDHDNCGE